ncbi:TetR/AcrR family transcriptional regulator [Sphingomonas sp. SUN019]|uniref:TetR/AcrR family transcriptional regulator n=1 Tax=Sphingomonas sp. SUN019 TaxID=2937788 RepID=UPI00216496BE|nr:TetR/AcrR family transcriptional regulator [Sphingomonas sp. SUN019]UVO51881.1 TetR/AcrR family transcriptional regulator [Sphingomonas sp. SUN019]
MTVETAYRDKLTVVKSDDRRAAMLDALADHVLAHGLSGSSLRPLAKAAGISDRMLLYYFPDKAAVVAATLEVVAARLTALMAERTGSARLPLETLRRELAAFLLDDRLWPYMRLWLEVASRAARDPFYRAVGERIGRGFLAWGAAQLDGGDNPKDAARLLVTIEGMVLLKSLGMEDVAALAV